MASSQPSIRSPQNGPSSGTLLGARPLVLSAAKLLGVVLTQLPLAQAAPMTWLPFLSLAEEEPMPSDGPTLWVYLLVAIGLVLLGGAFAGLTIALMGQVCKRDRSMRVRCADIVYRTRSTCKSSKRLGNRLKGNTLPRFSGY